MKKILLGVLGFAIMSAFFFGSWAQRAPAASNVPIKIGFSLPATGLMSQTGSVAMKATRAWANKINRTGGIMGHPVQGVFYDSESDPNKAILTEKEMINSDKVLMLLGGGSTGLALALGPIAAQNKVPYLANSGSSLFEMQMLKAGPETFKWNFRMSNCTSQEQTAWLLMLFSKMNIKKVAVIYSVDAYGQSGIASIKDGITKYPEYGMGVIVEQSYPSDAVTFGPLISALKAHPEVQGIYVRGATMASPLAIVAIKDAGLTIPQAGDSVQTSPQFMAVEKVKRGIIKDPGYYIYGDMSFWKELPDSNPAKTFYRDCYNFWKQELNIEADQEMYSENYRFLIMAQNVFTRLLKDKPHILDQDVATIRSSVRDYMETTKGLQLGGLITMSPTDHTGFAWGTSFRLGQYKKDGQCHYLSQYATPPEKR
jgi:branched-chain amino acid transport system substrate-binding protein